jgi:hypothetical protein
MSPKNNILTSARFIEAPVSRYRSNQSSLHEFDSFPISRHGRPLSENGSFSETGSNLSEDQASSLSSLEGLEISDNVPRFFSVYNRNSDLWELVSELVPRDFGGYDGQRSIWEMGALTREARTITRHLLEMEQIAIENGVLPPEEKDCVSHDCQTLISLSPNQNVENQEQEIGTEIQIIETKNIGIQTEPNWTFFESLKGKVTSFVQDLSESFNVLFGDEIKTIYFVCDSLFVSGLDLVEKVYSWFF